MSRLIKYGFSLAMLLVMAAGKPQCTAAQERERNKPTDARKGLNNPGLGKSLNNIGKDLPATIKNEDLTKNLILDSTLTEIPTAPIEIGEDLTSPPSPGDGGAVGSNGSGGGPRPPSSYHRTIVPAACLMGKQMQGEIPGEILTPVCDVYNAAVLGERLSDPDSDDIEHILLEFAAKKMVFLSFPSSMAVEERVELVKAMYTILEEEVDSAWDDVMKTQDDPVKVAFAERYALIDAQRIEAFQDAQYAQHQAIVERAIRTVETYPHSSHIQIRLGLAYRQLVGASHGINVFH